MKNQNINKIVVCVFLLSTLTINVYANKYAHAEKLLKKQKYKKAFRAYVKLYKQNKKDVKVLLKISEIAYKLKKFKTSLKALNKARKLERIGRENEYRIYYNLMRTYRRLKNYDMSYDAGIIAERFAMEEIENFKVHYFMTWLEYREDRVGGAYHYYRKALYNADNIVNENEKKYKSYSTKIHKKI